MRQKGFIQLSLMGWIAVGAAAIILGLSVALKVQTARLDSVKQEYAHFVADVKAKGEAAKVKADAENKLNKERKVKSDEELRKLRIANNDLTKRVRDNASSSFVSRETPIAGKPDLACYEPASLDGAIRNFATGVSGIIEQGQSAVTDLNNAKQWAASP